MEFIIELIQHELLDYDDTLNLGDDDVDELCRFRDGLDDLC